MLLAFISKSDGINYSMSESKNQTPLNIPAALEALLFISPEPVTPAQLGLTLEISNSAVEEGLKQLEVELNWRGLRLQRSSGRIQLTTSPEFADIIERFLGLEATTHLSRAALETLAIVAYQQPVSRPQVEAIRGVSSDGVMRSLLGKGLIQEVGRAEGPGRPILYGTSVDFLQHFGLNSLTELPPMNLPEKVTNTDSHDEMLKG
jgi:segregation and condensation protein B